jgi:hypothetical protein
VILLHESNAGTEAVIDGAALGVLWNRSDLD